MPSSPESDIDSWRDVERADKQARSPLSLDIFDQAAVRKVPFQCRYDDGARDALNLISAPAGRYRVEEAVGTFLRPLPSEQLASLRLERAVLRLRPACGI